MTSSDRLVGKCGNCGGPVTVPTSCLSVVPPIPSCQKCGAVKDVTAGLPTVEMVPGSGGRR